MKCVLIVIALVIPSLLQAQLFEALHELFPPELVRAEKLSSVFCLHTNGDSTILFFDSKGYVEKKEIYDSTGRQLSYSKRIYKGLNLWKDIDFNAHHDTVQYDEYYYEHNNGLVSKKSYFFYEQGAKKYTFTLYLYDSYSSRLHKTVTTTYVNEQLIETEIIKYNRQEKPVMITYVSKQPRFSRLIKYTDRHIEVISFDKASHDMQSVLKIVLNKQGLPDEIVCSDWKQRYAPAIKKDQLNLSFEYDKKGLVRHTLLDGKLFRRFAYE